MANQYVLGLSKNATMRIEHNERLHLDYLVIEDVAYTGDVKISVPIGDVHPLAEKMIAQVAETVLRKSLIKRAADKAAEKARAIAAAAEATRLESLTDVELRALVAEMTDQEEAR